MARVSIKEFGVIDKGLAFATLTVFVADENGENTGVKSVIYADKVGGPTVGNPLQLDSEGKLDGDFYVNNPVMGSLTNIPQTTVRSVKRLREGYTDITLPVTCAAYIGSNPDMASITDATIDNSPIGSITPSTGVFTNLTCSSFVETSDERLKIDIQPLEAAHALIMALEPVTYQRRGTQAHQRTEMGFIAQTVAKVLPETVAKGDYLSLHYLDMIALLVRGYQEQNQTIIDLTNRIKSLEEK